MKMNGLMNPPSPKNSWFLITVIEILMIVDSFFYPLNHHVYWSSSCCDHSHSTYVLRGSQFMDDDNPQAVQLDSATPK
jgi:hypothetical protein